MRPRQLALAVGTLLAMGLGAGCASSVSGEPTFAGAEVDPSTDVSSPSELPSGATPSPAEPSSVPPSDPSSVPPSEPSSDPSIEASPSPGPDPEPSSEPTDDEPDVEPGAIVACLQARFIPEKANDELKKLNSSDPRDKWNRAAGKIDQLHTQFLTYVRPLTNGTPLKAKAQKLADELKALANSIRSGAYDNANLLKAQRGMITACQKALK